MPETPAPDNAPERRPPPLTVSDPVQQSLSSAAAPAPAPPLRESLRRQARREPETGTPVDRTAVLVCHGMGQQVPFATLDLVLQPMLDKRLLPTEKVEVRLTRSGGAKDGTGKLLPVAQLKWEEDGRMREAHFFECYWAPLTEGKISLVDALVFLCKAGLEGIGHSFRGRFDRFLFGGPKRYPLSRARNLLVLLAAFLAVVSLAALSITLAAAVAYHGISNFGLALPRRGLFSVLTGELLLASRVALLCALPFLLETFISGIRRALWPGGQVTGPIPKAGLRAARAIGLSLLLAASILLHLFLAVGGTAPGLRVALLVGYGLALLGYVIAKLRAMNQGHGMGRYAWLSLALGWVAAVGPGAAALLSWFHLWGGFPGWGWETWLALSSMIARNGEARGLLLAHALLGGLLIWRGRYFLVEYVGDVAAYVSSHTVNKFAGIRDRIQEAGYQVASHVYGAMEEGNRLSYGEVFVVGHSLGSVVAYDTLNRMINQDLVSGSTLEVAGRTKLLLTFGSPLDKTAFLFRAQAKDTWIREALAEARQPLIRDYRFRPDFWINVWSPNDPISGSLEYYDPPADVERPVLEKRVVNLIDPEADIPMAAHTQYWTNRMVPEILAAALCRKDLAGLAVMLGRKEEA